MGVWIFLMTFLARLPVNYPVFWGVLLAVPVVCDTARGLAAAGVLGQEDRFRRAASRWRACRLRAAGLRALDALAGSAQAEASADGLAMHLAIPANIAANHAMTFEPSRFLWSVMPWARIGCTQSSICWAVSMRHACSISPCC